MTQVKVSEIPEEGLPLSFQTDAAALDLSVPGVSFPEPLAVELLLMKSANAVSAAGRIRVPATFECVRCLRRFAAPLDVTVATQFLHAAPSSAPGEHQMPKEEAENYYFGGDVIILDDLVRQETILAVPFSPQCREDCRGLCPQCGQDLNTGSCSCTPPPDPRWKALREHLKKT